MIGTSLPSFLYPDFTGKTDKNELNQGGQYNKIISMPILELDENVKKNVFFCSRCIKYISNLDVADLKSLSIETW